MAYRPSYRHDRAERDRNKQAKKAEKLRRKIEGEGLPEGEVHPDDAEDGTTAGEQDSLKGETDVGGLSIKKEG